jgi:hypothetical protein
MFFQSLLLPFFLSLWLRSHHPINSFQKAKKNRYHQQRRVLVPKKKTMIYATLYYFESIEIANYLEGVGRVQAASSVLSARKKNPVS